MFPVSDLAGIEHQETANERRKAVVLLLVKPSDDNAKQLIEKFNYYHFKSREYCSIYAAGYGTAEFREAYSDAHEIAVVDKKTWLYSDRCFVQFCEQLSARTKWEYCGEPEILLLQTSVGVKSSLDFRNYVSIDAYRGVRMGYIESISRFMESIINSTKKEVEAKLVLKKATRFSATQIAKTAIEATLELSSGSKIPKSETLKKVLEDRLFYRSTIKRRKQFDVKLDAAQHRS